MGLAQFMPNTANWMPEIDKELASPNPYNPIKSSGIHRATRAFSCPRSGKRKAQNLCHAMRK